MISQQPIFTWEQRLLEIAHAALDFQPLEIHAHTDDKPVLERAYQYCAELTRFHSRTFYLASGLLPPVKRRAMRALYAFCRVSDDLIDRPTQLAGQEILPGRTDLAEWQALALYSGSITDLMERVSLHRTAQNKSPDFLHLSGDACGREMVALAWNHARREYQIPPLYGDQLISGVAVDLEKCGYANFDELVDYCYGVACTVGLMAMHITGFRDVAALSFAIRLGIALQLTNILRDVGEDWRQGRLYLAQDELDAFGLSRMDIDQGVVTNRWRAFMRFQIERARLLFAEAVPGIALLDSGARFAILAAAELYQGILGDIQQHDYDVFYRRAALSTTAKLRRLPDIWWRARTIQVLD